MTTHATDIGISNGLGWSPDGRSFYLIDSAAQSVDVFDVDLDDAQLSNRRRLIDVPKELGLPDGLAVDAEGCLWIAMCFGGVIYRYTPEGVVDSIVRMPVPVVTSVAFAGSRLFITTGRVRDMSLTRSYGLDPAAVQPGAGWVYSLDAGVEGLPMYRFGALG